MLCAGASCADGLPLSNGRYPGKVLVFDLTAAQKKTIDRFRTCHLEKFRTMNVYTPYVFTLSASQASALRQTTGLSPKFFEVYETYRGYNDAGPQWNLALRFNENQIEIPLDLLVSDKDAKENHKEQGWKANNPCFPRLNQA